MSRICLDDRLSLVPNFNFTLLCSILALKKILDAGHRLIRHSLHIKKEFMSALCANSIMVNSYLAAPRWDRHLGNFMIVGMRGNFTEHGFLDHATI